MPTIWRAAAAKPSNAICLTHPSLILGLLRNPSSASRTPTAFGQNQKRDGADPLTSAEGAELTDPPPLPKARNDRSPASAEGAELNRSPASTEGVGVWLADDLARSGSKTVERNWPDTPRHPI